MTRHPSALVLVPFLVVALAGAGHAQAPAAAPAGEPVPTTLRLQVVLARYDGEKKISSLPYTMSTNTQPGSRSMAQVRMGADIPVSGRSSPSSEGKPAPAVTYDQIGTQIDCHVRQVADGRYAVELSISDKSVYADEGTRPATTSLGPTFRAFRAVNSVLLRDGQTVQFTAATDRMTGEVVRVEVTLQVAK